MKKISVIIPCYNVKLWVDRCLISIVRQTMGIDDLEIICVDDASTDGTWERLQEWEQRYPENIFLIRQEVNRRQGTARNTGLQYASAKWVSFMDADDWVEPDYFEQLYGAGEKYDCDVVCCGHKRDVSTELVYFDKDVRHLGGLTGLIMADTEEMTMQLLKDEQLGAAPWGKIIRKRLLLKGQIFFPEDIVFEDTFWCPLLHIYAERVYLINERLYHWFVNLQSVVRSKDQTLCLDWIAVHLMKWNEYAVRGFLQKYADALEYNFLCDAIKILAWLCECNEPSYSIYRLLKQIVTETIPEPKDNRYFTELGGYFKCFLEALYTPLNKEGFWQFRMAVEQMKHVSRGLEL